MKTFVVLDGLSLPREASSDVCATKARCPKHTPFGFLQYLSVLVISPRREGLVTCVTANSEVDLEVEVGSAEHSVSFRIGLSVT